MDRENATMITQASRRMLMGMGSTVLLAGLAATGRAKAQMPVAGGLRILLLNPNSSPDFTKIIAAEARRVGSPGTEFVDVTAPFGPRYIGTRATIAVAGHATVDALAQTLARDQRFDAAILAGFGAQGVPALQEMAPFPVVDMLTASVGAALLLGRKFSALTGGERWVPMLEEQIEAFGLGSRLASVRSIPLTGAEIAKDQDKALTLLAELAETCVREDGADCVILGGAAVAGLHRRMADRVSVPLLDSVATSVAMAELLARVATRPTKARAGLPAIESVGLSDELSSVLKPAL
jgi:allantoin racemase